MSTERERVRIREQASERRAMNTTLDPAIDTYISEVQAICSGGYSLPSKVRRIQEAARRHIAKPLDLSEELRYIPPTGYGRNLIHRDPEHGFVLIAMVWPPNTIGSPHDHQTWGVVAVSEGSIRICNFERDDDGSNTEQGNLVEKIRIDGKPGDVGYVLPPHEDIHSISNHSSAPAVSLHTYGRDIKRCRVFDKVTGKIQWVDLAYHQEGVS